MHNSYQFNLSLGRILVVNKKEIVCSTNLPLSARLQKENVSFQLEWINRPNIVTSTNRFYGSLQPTIFYEFFPFLNAPPVDSTSFPKKNVIRKRNFKYPNSTFRSSW